MQHLTELIFSCRAAFRNIPLVSPFSVSPSLQDLCLISELNTPEVGLARCNSSPLLQRCPRRHPQAQRIGTGLVAGLSQTLGEPTAGWRPPAEPHAAGRHQPGVALAPRRWLCQHRKASHTPNFRLRGVRRGEFPPLRERQRWSEWHHIPPPTPSPWPWTPAAPEQLLCPGPEQGGGCGDGGIAPSPSQVPVGCHCPPGAVAQAPWLC